ncbi:hypothetical protein [Sphingobacterium sp. WOUb80]|uniref:hypothetical protein n=1 Tax=Sphingobacterium sp. WOUb80 TaxID=3234028 RepID=UPI003CFA8362
MNLIKIIKTNVMPILGVAIAAGLTVSTLTSAGIDKSEKQTDPYYPMVGGVYQSTPLDPLKEGDLEDGWDCIEQEEQICSGQFSTPPSPSNQNPDGGTREGQYVDHSSN